MKYKYSVLLILLLWISVSAHAQLFRPFASFQSIRTEYFDIIFPRESEFSARLLASYADRVYREMRSLFGMELPGRIPVVLAPHTDLFNGFYSPIPTPRIVLFDTPMDPEWTIFPDAMKGLFIHELAHAITMNTRSRFWSGLHRIFGNWATPAFWTAPLFMVEGAAILMESLDQADLTALQPGFGRANDPLVRQTLRQAIHEGQFLSPLQASGVIDRPGHRGAFYDYGGLFSWWLVENFGMEYYARLWQAMGRTEAFTFSVYRSGFYRSFERVYGIRFIDAWNAFRASLALTDLKDNPNEILPERAHFFTERRHSISALTAQGDNVFILDGQENRIHVYNAASGNIRSFNTSFLVSDAIDVSTDGTTMLVSGYHLTTGDRFRAMVVEHNTDTGRRTGRTIQGLYRARYFRDGVVGIRSDLHNTLIVFEDFNGNSEVLFRGNSTLQFSSPQVIDNERITFVAVRNGERALLIYNFASGELFRIETDSDEDWHENIWRYKRGLSVSGENLFFSHNIDDRMYKLAVINLETMQAVLSTQDFSGGVFLPVSVNGNVYYRAAFFRGDNLKRYPYPLDSLPGIELGLRLERLNKEDYGHNVFVRQDYANRDFEPRPYLSFLRMNPFRFWLPLPLLRSDSDNNIRLDGAGLFSIMTDPVGRHLITTVAYADVEHNMVEVEHFSWQNTVPGFPLTLNFSDTVLTDSWNRPYRDTRLSLSASLLRSPGRFISSLTLGGGYAREAFYDGGGSAYSWQETDSFFFYFAGIALSNIQRQSTEMFGTGLSLSLRGMSFWESFEPRFEFLFRASVETRFPLSLALYGVFDERRMNLHGVSNSYGQPLFAQFASTEYYRPRGLNLLWLAGAEATVGLFSFEIQNNISHAYFNRLFGSLSLRSVIYDSYGRPDAQGTALNAMGDNMLLAQSLILRLGMTTTFIPLKLSPLIVEPNIWGAWKFSNTITGEGDTFNFGAGVNIRF